MWHIDTTIIRLLDGSRAYVHAVIDNYSRRILSWRVAGRFEPANTVFITMGNDETAATETWKRLRAESLPNVYILEGGVNNWIGTFGDDSYLREQRVIERALEQPAYRFEAALGARHPAAEPNPAAYEFEFEPKVKLELKRAPTGGGCG